MSCNGILFIDGLGWVGGHENLTIVILGLIVRVSVLIAACSHWIKRLLACLQWPCLLRPWPLHLPLITGILDCQQVSEGKISIVHVGLCSADTATRLHETRGAGCRFLTLPDLLSGAVSQATFVVSRIMVSLKDFLLASFNLLLVIRAFISILLTQGKSIFYASVCLYVHAVGFLWEMR